MINRRRFLALTGSLALTGCIHGDESTESPIGQIGSGRAGRPAPGGTPMSEMPDLEGSLHVYSGRGEFLVGDLVRYIENLYDDFTLTVRYGGSTDLVNRILTEGQNTSADVFYSVNAGSLGVLSDEERTQDIRPETREKVRDEFTTSGWVGTSGRARTIPFNTNEYTREDIPDDIHAFTDFDGDLGWAPSYGSCQAFLTAMRLLDGETQTREWIQAILDDITSYPDEFAVCQAIANGEIDAGFTNHYYIQRVLDGSPDAPISTAFTMGDAGSVFNVAGAAVIDSTQRNELAQNFILHLLSSEAQEYFATTTYEYPLIPDVEPVGDLPSIDELNPPSGLDLSDLSNLQPTIDLMRDAGVEI